MCLRKSKKARAAEAELKAKKKAIRDEAAAQQKQADFEARERARKYPCTGGAEIVTARPAGMSYDTYRKVRARQQKQIRAYLKYGHLIYKATEYYIVKAGHVEVPYTEENANNGMTMRRTWPPYRRPKLLSKEAVDAALQNVKTTNA